MRLWHFQEPLDGGCLQYREQQPLDALRARGHEIHTSVDLDACRGDAWDGFLFSRVYWGEYPLFVAEVKECEKPIIYDCDDAWDQIPGWYPPFLECQAQLPAAYFFLHQADLVTTTTDRLAAHLRGLGARRVAVLPNCVDSRLLPWQQPTVKDVPRVGFVGTVGHMESIVPLLVAAGNLRRRGVVFDLVLMGLGLQQGDTLDTLVARGRTDLDRRHRDWPRVLGQFEMALRSVPGRVEWHASLHTAAYWQAYRGLDLDIGCMPLSDTIFDSCRSFSKFTEYAALGALTLCSPGIFDGSPVVYVQPNTAEGWADRLEWWIAHDAERRRIAAVQQAFVRDNRQHATWAPIRERAYRTVVAERVMVDA